MKIFFETERLIIRELLSSDTEGMYVLDSNPEVHRYLGNKPIKSKSEAKVSIEAVRQQYEEFGIGRWAIINKEDDDFVGWTGLKFEQKPVNGRNGYFDLGYRLRPEYWGKGIATETARLAIGYGFEALDLAEINAAAAVDNVASNVVLQKVGLLQTEQFAYQEILCNWYALKRTDWQD